MDNEEIQVYIKEEKVRLDGIEIRNKSLGDIHYYFDLFDDKSCLDGWFTANELRRIADAMDELKVKSKLGGNYDRTTKDV